MPANPAGSDQAGIVDIVVENDGLEDPTPLPYAYLP
jgi:hypothetical protein